MKIKNITPTKESVLKSLTDAGFEFEENPQGKGSVLETKNGEIIPLFEKKEKKNSLQVFFCCFVNDDDWGSFVVAESHSKAKTLFLRSFNDCGEWNDVRCRKVKDIPKDVTIEPGCLDLPDDPILTKLGLKYQEPEI